MNGRTTIWSHAPDFILESPIVGHGPESSGPYLHELANRWEMSFRAGNFHNALLEALAEYGLIGGALLVAAATSYIRRARRWPSPTRDAVFVFVLVSAMTEALFFSLDYGVFLLVACLVAVADSGQPAGSDPRDSSPAIEARSDASGACQAR